MRAEVRPGHEPAGVEPIEVAGAVPPGLAGVAPPTVPVRPRRRAPNVATAVAMVLVALVAVLARDRGEGERTISPLLDRPAPAIVGVTIDGATLDLSARKGSRALVNFFQTTCTPCKQEHPDLISFVTGGGRAKLGTMVYSDSTAKVTAFFVEKGGAWPVASAPRNRVSVAYGVTAVPETFVIDPDGVVREHITGPPRPRSSSRSSPGSAPVNIAPQVDATDQDRN